MRAPEPSGRCPPRRRSVFALGAAALVAVAAAVVAGCAGNTGSAGTAGTAGSTAEPRDTDAATVALLQRSFIAQGQARLDRLVQDPLQRACSGATPPSDDMQRRLEARERAAIEPPPGRRYLGDWREGEKLAQNGRGLTWSDAPGSVAGGSCYNCHRIGPAEIAYGTVGPSLYRYGALRGVVDPSAAAAVPVVEATWARLYDAKAFNACSAMPRFGAAHLLTTAQLQDLMALLLDPASPVNREAATALPAPTPTPPAPPTPAR